jgi:hypothetical protein
MKKRKLFAGVAFLALPFLITAGASPVQTLKTPAEESNYLAYSQHEEIARFLSAIDFLSKEAAVQIIGQTKAVREFPAVDLLLCIITEEGATTPQALNRQKPTMMLTASQHGNEQSAKEAALWMIRDLSLGELKPLLKKMNFLIIPQANPYGNWFDRRQNEQDLDLNRDHVKLESEETAAIHRVFRSWMPEVTLDLHEKGDDYYRVSIGCVSNANIHPTLQEFSRKRILAAVEESLGKKKIAFYEYLVTQEMGIDSSAGVRYSPEELRGRELLKRYSTTDLNDGRNSLGIYETLSFIQECSSRHDLETLKERTRWQYSGICAFTEAVGQSSTEVTAMVHTLRDALREKARTYSEKDIVHLNMEYVRDPQNPELILKKFDRADSPLRGILRVDKKAGDPLAAAELAPYPYPSDYKVVTENVKNWFPNVEPRLSVPRPLGYIIPAKHLDLVATLLRHGLLVEVLTQDRILEVEAYQAVEVSPSKYDYLPPERIEVEKKALQTVAKRGDFYISCSQDGANLIPCLLEPQSQYGLIRYWSFKLVPAPGDVYAFLRVIKPQDLPLFPYRNFLK